MSSENVLQTVKTAIQDIVAPEVRELKAEVKALGQRIDSLERRLDERFTSFEKRMDERFTSFEKRMDERFAAINDRFEASNARADAQFQAILAAIARSTAENELMVYKQVNVLTQRVAALEAVRQ